jgi:uncharacterized protein (TIGR02147 family)
MDSIYHYTDFRQYLRDAQVARKALNSCFSLRYIAKRLGVRSPASWLHVLRGTNRMSRRMVQATIKLFQLDGGEARYFQALVGFGQAHNDGERREWLEEMMDAAPSSAVQVKPQQYRFYAKWYYQAVWALMGCHRFTGDYRDLGRQLEPPVTTGQAREAVQVLLNLGLLVKDGDGRIRQASRVVTTGEQASQTAHQVFQLAAMDLAKRAIDKLPKGQRQLATLTLALGEPELRQAMELMARCRRHLLAIAEKSVKADRVHQFNFQSFALTRWPRT